MEELNENSRNQKNSKSTERFEKIDTLLAYIDSRSGEHIPPQTNYSALFWMSLESNPELSELVRSRLEGKSVIDLGSGGENFHIGSIKDFGIKSYTAVDRYYDLTESNKKTFEEESKGGFASQFIKKDMLKFVSELPDNSSNFIISGIDIASISDPLYWDYLVEELARATETNGLVVGYNALDRVDEYLVKSKQFKLVKERDNFFIVEKV